jgi:hypothetical protein
MKVVDIELKHGELRFIHQCETCDHRRANKAHPEDNIDTITELMSTLKK